MGHMLKLTDAVKRDINRQQTRVFYSDLYGYGKKTNKMRVFMIVEGKLNDHARK